MDLVWLDVLHNSRTCSFLSTFFFKNFLCLGLNTAAAVIKECKDESSASIIRQMSEDIHQVLIGANVNLARGRNVEADLTT